MEERCLQSLSLARPLSGYRGRSLSLRHSLSIAQVTKRVRARLYISLSLSLSLSFYMRHACINRSFLFFFLSFLSFL